MSWEFERIGPGPFIYHHHSFQQSSCLHSAFSATIKLSTQGILGSRLSSHYPTATQTLGKEGFGCWLLFTVAVWPPRGCVDSCGAVAADQNLVRVTFVVASLSVLDRIGSAGNTLVSPSYLVSFASTFNQICSDNSEIPLPWSGPSPVARLVRLLSRLSSVLRPPSLCRFAASLPMPTRSRL
jgi:hypothetical protein